MEHFRAAERALVTALVLGQADPAELAGRVRPADFTDPAAGVLFEVAMRFDAGSWSPEDLPAVLLRRGLLRRDGYPISDLLEWMPRLPVPIHVEAWAILVVAGTLGRQVHASGVRLQQSAEAALEGRYPPGRVLAMVAAQRAALASGWHRWEALPARWRDTLPERPAVVDPALIAQAPLVVGGEPEGAGRERALLAGLVAAPQLLGRIPWLAEPDFTDPSCAAVFTSLRRLHEAGHPVDVVTLPASCDPALPSAGLESPATLAAGLRPEQAMPTSVPFLARQILGHAISRDVHRVGGDLVQLAAAPAATGGLGGTLLTAAHDRLETLRPYAVRLENATRESRPSIAGRNLAATRTLLPASDRARPDAVGSLGRHAS